ncbi:MAG TPA: hypothetical protein VI790_01230 [Candidatus Nanoarchaeia archaeon]|nr:hypothetical protein [Candidatus Nanoarchaeia archaeon]
MAIDLTIMTLYGMITWTITLIVSHKMDHIHHWMFGLTAITITVPVIAVNAIVHRIYYDQIVVVGLILGVFSFIIDFHDFKKWLKDKKH